MAIELKKDITNEIKHVLSLVMEFHQKYGIGISVRSQEEMYSRSNLLLEELGELLSSIESGQDYLEEFADVYYVLTGNLVSMGYEIRHESSYVNIIDSFDISFGHILSDCALIARDIRKNWDPENSEFVERLTSIHMSVLSKLYLLGFKHGIYNLINAVENKHVQNMKRKSRMVGNTVVVSTWSDSGY